MRARSLNRVITVPLVRHRPRRNRAHAPDSGYRTLGRWGLPVNLVAVLFGGSRWSPSAGRALRGTTRGQGWVPRYAAPLTVVVAVGLGLVAYPVMRRQRARQGSPGVGQPAAVCSPTG